MAGLLFTVTSGEITFTAASSTVGLQILAPTNQTVLLESLRIMGEQPAGGSDATVLVKLQLCTAANKGTGTTATPVKLDQRMSGTIQTACQSASSAGAWILAPSSLTDNGDWWAFNPQTGIIEHFDRDRFRVIPPGYALNVLVVTQASMTPKLNINATCEE